MTEKNTTHPSEQQIRYYRGIIERIRKGTIVSAARRHNLNEDAIYKMSSTTKLLFWMKYVNPERLAAEQVIIEEFSNSKEYIKFEAKVKELSIMTLRQPNPLEPPPYSSDFYPHLENLTKAYLREFISSIDNEEKPSPTKTALKLLDDNQMLFGTQHSYNKTYEQNLFSGFGTAIDFCHSLESVVAEKIRLIPELALQANANKIISASKATFLAQGTFFGSFSIKTHSASLDLLGHRNSSFLNLSYDPDNFEGDLSNGKPLRPKKVLLYQLKTLMKEASERPTAKFECPAIITHESRSAMQKFMGLMANSMLFRMRILKEFDEK